MAAFPLAAINGRVEILIDGNWVLLGDPTAPDTLGPDYRLRSMGSISRGRSDDRSRTSPASLSLTCWNDDGWLTPNDPRSPYWPDWARGCQLRVRRGNSVRMLGEVSEIRPVWPHGDVSTSNAVTVGGVPVTVGGVPVTVGTSSPGAGDVEVVVSGILRRLQQRTKPLRSPLFREVTAPANRPHITHYWPMEDGKTAEWFGSGLPGSTDRMEFDGFQLASNSDQPGSESLPQATTQTVASYLAYTPGSPDGEWGVEAWVVLPSETWEDTTVTVLNVQTSGTIARWLIDLSVPEGGGDLELRLRMYNAAGGLIATFLQDLSAIVDQPARIRLTAEQVGGSVAWSMIYNRSEYNATQYGGGTTTSGTCGRVTSVSGAGTAAGWSIGHVLVHDGLANGWTAGADAGHIRESAYQRVVRLCGEENISIAVPADSVEESALLGVQKTNPFLSLLEEAADADGGRLAERLTALGLRYWTRRTRYNREPVLTLDAGLSQIANPFAPTEDDQQIRNEVTVTRIDGTSATVSIPQLDQSSDEYDEDWPVYNEGVNLSLAFDSDVKHHAGWRLHLGTWEGLRYPQVTVDLALVSVALRTQFEALAVGDQIRITNLPPQHPIWPSTVDLVVEGWSEDPQAFGWSVTFNCVPAGPWRVARWGISRWHSADSTLVNGITSTQTNFEVDTPGQEWTQNAAHFPMHILVGPELMRVTSIAGGGPVQVMYVARNVNGLARAHDAGTSVAPCGMESGLPDYSILAL